MLNRNRLCKPVCFLLALATAVVSLSACRGAVNSERTIIRFAVYDTDFSRFQSLAERFERENPDVQVRLVSIDQTLGRTENKNDWSDDDWKKLAAMADTLAVGPLVEVTKKKLLRDLSPLMEADAGFHPQDFYPGALKSQQWENGTWGVPAAISFYLIFYDKTVFDEAGVAPPEMAWRTADFTAKAQALTERKSGIVTRYGFVPDASIVHTMLVADQAGPLVDEQVDPPLPRLDTPEMQRAVAWYTDLAREQIIPAPIVEGYLHGRRDLAQSGKAAMWSGGLSRLIHPDTEYDVGVVPLPCGQEGSCSTFLGVESYVMSAGTLYPQESWRWLAFLTRVPPQELTGKDYFIPARRSMTESADFWQNLQGEEVEVLQYILAHNSSIHWEVGYVLEELHQAIASVLRGDETVADALTRAQAQAEERILAIYEQAGATPVAVSTLEAEATQIGHKTGIIFAVGTDPEVLQAIRQIAEKFNASQNAVHVDVIQPDMTMESFGISAMTQQADCFTWFGETQMETYTSNLLSLDALLDGDLAFAPDDFFPQGMKTFRVDGRQWGIPAYIQPAVMRYNREMFDTAGVPYPAPDWNLEDFLDIAYASSDAEKKQYGFVPHVCELDELLFFVEQRGGQIVDMQQEPAMPQLDSPKVVKGVQWYLDLGRFHEVKPSFACTKDELYDNEVHERLGTQRLTMIRDGRAAMWIELPKHSGDHGIDVSDLDTGVVPLPQGPGRAGAFEVAGYFISAQSEHPRACWTWIDFLTREVGAAIGLPARRSAAESAEYRRQAEAEIARAYLLSMAHARPDSVRYQGQEWIGPFHFWFIQAFLDINSGAEIQIALSMAQEKAEKYRQCVHASNGFADRAIWQSCAAQIDPAYPVSPSENP